MHQLDQAARFTAAEDGRPTHFIEHVRAPALSVGTYSVPAGGVDDQVPHAEDEVYVVLAGRGAFTSGRKTVDVEAGTVLFVPAHEEHRFHDVSEDLAVLVMFAPAYTGRPSTPDHQNRQAGR